MPATRLLAPFPKEVHSRGESTRERFWHHFSDGYCCWNQQQYNTKKAPVADGFFPHCARAWQQEYVFTLRIRQLLAHPDMHAVCAVLQNLTMVSCVRA